MKKSIFFLLFHFTLLGASSQEKLSPFGKADRKELEMKECEFDRNANALRLLDYQEKEIIAEYGLKIKTERRIKIKIFNEKGFDAASIIIPYISRIKGTKITDISACIHYLDSSGNIVTEKVNKNQIFRDKEDETLKKIKFAFPNVRSGCVIEYRYEKVEKNSLHLEPWYFQDFIPTLYSKFTLIMPSGIRIDKRVIGIDSVDESFVSDKGSSNFPVTYRRTYALRNINAFRPEPLMTSVSDNLQRIEFAVQPSGFVFFDVLLKEKRWKIYAAILNEVPFFGKQFNKPVPGTELVLDSAKKIISKEEKINYLYQQVKHHIKWDNQQTFYAGDISQAWKEQSGNSAEINLTILNLLKRSGIACSPVLISTRNNGLTDPDFFTLSQFNGVDVLILDSIANYVLDGTRKYQSYKTPPDNILNRYAFNADTAFASWVLISDSRPLLKSIVSVTATLSDSGLLKGSGQITFYDHSKVQRMADMNKTEEEEEEEEKEFLKKDFTELKIDSLVRENAEDDLNPLVERFNFSYQPSASDKFLFLDPFFLSSFRKNPFPDSIRHSSIDFSSRQYLKTAISITIPDSYEVDHLPKNILLRMSDSSILFERAVYFEGNKIYFKNVMEVLYPFFTKEEYPGLKDFFNRLYGMVAEQIILKRKK